MPIWLRPAALLAVAMILAAFALPARASPACPPGNGDYPPFYDDARFFRNSFDKAAGLEPSGEKLSGITVPHHLLADRLVAEGFKAASGFRYKRIVILSPDHFRKADKPFATTRRGFQTVLGTVPVDGEAVARLLDGRDWTEESCLFDKEHGVRAMLPFVRRYFPDTPIVPVAMSVRSARGDWDRLAEALAPLVGDDTLIVESSDFSHYLPQHEARRFDQQTLNVIASGSLDRIALLRQPQHLDSVGALYVQMKLQREGYGAAPLVVASENSQRYSERPSDSTTSYQLILFGRFAPGLGDPAPPGATVYYFAGDTNFGRGMKRALLDPEAAVKVADAVLARTGGRPLIVNLEGVILPNVPEAIDDMTLAMPEDLAAQWLGRLNVVAVGLANNHALDLGPSGYAETVRALDAAGIAHFGQGEHAALPGLDVVGLTDLGNNDTGRVDLLTPGLLDRLAPEGDEGRPVVAFVHWGREYENAPSARETALADAMRLRAATVIIGAHPHVASEGIVALGGGDAAEIYSLGNFLFDQNAARSSGQMVELRVFEQGTVFARTIPLPNLYDLATK